MAVFRGWLAVALLGASVAALALETAELATLMDDARQAMREAQYNLAIQHYRRLLELPDNAYRRDAQELLGLAYERNGQLEQARQEYERYLQLYPEGDGAERVRQRLAGIVTAAWQEQDASKKLRPEKQTQRSEWQHYGSLSQYLRRDVSQFEQQPAVVGNYSLTTLLDVTSRGRSGDLEIKSRVSGSYLYDLGDISGHQPLLGYLYLDLKQRRQGWSGRIGRQRADGGGVLGRYDGLDLGVRLTPRYSLGLVAGMPVESTTMTRPDSSRRFYGVNLKSGPWRDYWELNGYLIQQQADGLLDRRAVGGELRYLHPEHSLYTLLDYDISYGTLNIATLQGSWIAPDRSAYYLLLDYRNGPAMTTRNALIGQNATKLTALSLAYSEQQIRQLAEDRTPHSRLAMAGISRPLGERYRLDADFSVASVAATPASGGVLASGGSGNEYYLSTQLTGSSFFRPGDVTIFGLRLGDSALNSSITLLGNSRLPLSERSHLTPRVQLGYQNFAGSGDTQQSLFPSLRFEYAWNRLSYLWLDGGYEWSRRNLWLGSQSYTNYHIEAGYRLGF